jgi:hypothetical protein
MQANIHYHEKEEFSFCLRKNLAFYLHPLLNGGRSSAGRAPDCGSGCRGFEPHRSP